MKCQKFRKISSCHFWTASNDCSIFHFLVCVPNLTGLFFSHYYDISQQHHFYNDKHMIIDVQFHILLCWALSNLKSFCPHWENSAHHIFIQYLVINASIQRDFACGDISFFLFFFKLLNSKFKLFTIFRTLCDSVPPLWTWDSVLAAAWKYPIFISRSSLTTTRKNYLVHFREWHEYRIN